MTSLNKANQKEAIYKVLAKNGKTYTWRFTEVKSEADYGNGIYIGVEPPSKDHYSIDCRYSSNYKFHKACVDYLLNYYGENLDELWEEEQA